MSIHNLPRPAISCHPSDDAAGDVVQFLLDGLPSSALLTDGGGKVIMVNRHAERFLGWPAAKLIGQPAHEWFDCYSEELAAGPENCPIARTLQGENVASPGRMWLSCRGAVAKPVEYRCSRYPTGSGTGVILAFNDLTRELAVEKDLRSLASIAEACPLAIVELNEDANSQRINPVSINSGHLNLEHAQCIL
jgi:PAS domain S-box-containing protein